MSYFGIFPTIKYNDKLVTDITRKVVIQDEIKENAALWQMYSVKDGEYPEDVAYNFYGSSTYVNLILLMNDIIDPFYGWVLDISTFNEYIRSKYKNIHAVHHYEANELIVHESAIGAKPISNYDHEFKLNEKKRLIRILKPEYVPIVIEEMETKLHQQRRDKAKWQN